MIDLNLLKTEVERLTKIKDISSTKSNQQMCAARALYFDIARKNTVLSYEELGATLKVNHCNALNAIKKLPKYLKKFPELVKHREYLIESEMFLDQLTNEERSVKDLERALTKFRHKNYQLNVELSELQEKYAQEKYKRDQKSKKVHVENSRLPLLELINQVPEYHIGTVKMRLEPMIKMLEKPSRHNYLPSN